MLLSAFNHVSPESLTMMSMVSREWHGVVNFCCKRGKGPQKRWAKHLIKSVDEARAALVSSGVAAEITKVNCDAARKMNYDLTVGASIGIRVDFSDEGGRATYTHEKLYARSRIVATVLLMDHAVMGWVRHHLFMSPTCRVASIGGGPGFDALSLSFMAQHFELPGFMMEVCCWVECSLTLVQNLSHTETSMQVEVYDIEAEWEPTVDAVAKYVSATGASNKL